MITTAIITTNNVVEANAQQDTMKSTPADLVNALHTAFGEHHARAVHAKGIIFEGTFTPAKEAATLTTAKHLQEQQSKMVIRFSDFTGIPDIPDNMGAANPRGMALKFILPGGETTDIVAHSFNGFPTANSDQFRELLLAIGASGAGAAKPTALDSFLETHPVAKTFLTTQHTPASYASISYFGVNSFEFTNKNGVCHFIRYQFVPMEGEQLLTPAQLSEKGPEYLMNEIKEHITNKPVYFIMYAQIANAADVIDNPSITWSDNNKRVKLGVIQIRQLGDNSTAADKGLFFIPNNIPDGIKTADPMLNFRAHAYPVSVKERQ